MGQNNWNVSGTSNHKSLLERPLIIRDPLLSNKWYKWLLMQQQPLIAQSPSPTFKNDPDTYFSSVEIPKASAFIASFTVVFKSSNSSDVGDRLSVCEPVSLWYYIPLNRSYSCQDYTYFAYPGDLSSEKGPLHRDSDHQVIPCLIAL